MRTSLAVAALLGAACIPESGPLMDPNQDCLACHSGDGEGPTWTVAGTFGGKGSRIQITDANGWSFALHAARNGNFYTAEEVAFPITVSVDGKLMADDGGVLPVEYGGCNICHGPNGTVIETGENMLPGSDCLRCHRAGTRIKAFSVAGTWDGPGRTISVSGVPNMTTNSVGNFFTEVPTSFPKGSNTASVNGEVMKEDLPHGSCNVCHPFGRRAED